jgi:type VI secretion system protein ImpM
MQFGLFGKLPVKRDFIAANMPRGVLALWEEWLMPSVAASREALGDSWQESFLTAPIWRFWLGGKLGGIAVKGAFMPSVDGVGRYFPLMICAWPEAGEKCLLPVCGGDHVWFAALEEVLLRVLDPDFTGEPTQLLADMTMPADHVPQGLERDFADDLSVVLAGRSYWWSIGGAGRPALMRSYAAMPDPYQFSGFITGQFEADFAP